MTRTKEQLIEDGIGYIFAIDLEFKRFKTGERILNSISEQYLDEKIKSVQGVISELKKKYKGKTWVTDVLGQYCEQEK